MSNRQTNIKDDDRQTNIKDNRCNHYYRYQMTYPFESNKVYKSRSLNKVAHKCSNEFQKMDDIGEGMFCITNLDKNVEYKFKIKNNKIYKKNQSGGNGSTKKQVDEINKLGDDDGDIEPNQIIVDTITNHDKTIKEQLSKHDTNIKEQLEIVQSEIISKLEKVETAPVKSAKIITPPETEEMEDLFEGVDPFDLNLKRLYALQKMKNINNEDQDICIIL